ncbi:MAG: EamA family transporter, partial [candidate division Zixibacteria bacterium]|nr:EamA family transporter [Gammaproteobacteria bacterium]NIX59679.1 EamA family transporter [candidate division Zixibacteria bacterium]
ALVPLLFLFRQQLKGIERQVWGQAVLIGLALFSGYAFLNWGLVYTTTAKAGFVIGLRVVLVPVMAAGLFRNSVANSSWIGALLSAIGLGFIFFGSTQSLGSFNPGDVLMLFCAASFAMHVLLVSRYTKPQNFAPNLFAQISVVMILSGIGMLLFEEVTIPKSQMVWEDVIITGLFSTALAFWLQNR